MHKRKRWLMELANYYRLEMKHGRSPKFQWRNHDTFSTLSDAFKAKTQQEHYYRFYQKQFRIVWVREELISEEE